MSATSPLRAIALAEFTRRRDVQRQGLAAGRVSHAMADGELAHWAALARFFGADLPEAPGTEVCDDFGRQRIWIEFYPPSMTADMAMRAMADRLRTATRESARRHQAAPVDAALRDRCRGLLRLDMHIAPLAGLPPVFTTLAEEGAPAPADKAA